MRAFVAIGVTLASVLVACGKTDLPRTDTPTATASTTSELPMLTLSGSDAGRPIDVKVGQRFAVRLAGNRTTGYEWKLASALTVMTQLGEQTYTPDPSPPGMVGRGGVEGWSFEATRSGREDLRFEYRRPWEKDQPAADTVTYSITVR